MLGTWLAVLIMFAGIGIMFGGVKTGKKIFMLPFKFLGNLALDLIHGVANLGFDLLGKGLSELGHQLNRGIRHLFRLPPPRRRPRPHPAHHDEHEEEDGDEHGGHH